MNSAGNNLLNVSNNAGNTITEAYGSFGGWILFVGVVLLLVFAYVIYNRQMWEPTIYPIKSSNFGENWCFVGEDVTGRWCVKVPRPDACAPQRLFSTRPGCELVPASPLPLGLVERGGAKSTDLASLHSK